VFVDIHAYHLRPLLVALAVSGVMAACAAQPGPAGMTVQKALPQREPVQSSARIVQNYGRLPLRFEANQGQTNKSVRFLSHGAGYALYLTDREAVLALQKQVGADPARTDVVRMQVVGANTKAEPTGLNRLPGKSNYLLGDDPALWHTNIPAYSKVRYASVYPGVDLVYHGNQKQLEYDFVVAPCVQFRGHRFLLIDHGPNGFGCTRLRHRHFQGNPQRIGKHLWDDRSFLLRIRD